MLELEPEAAGEPATLTDIGKPFEEWDLDDQYNAYSLPLIGKKAQIHGLDSKSRFNGMIVKLEHWNRANQYFEARLDKTQAIIKVGIENVKVLEDGDAYKDPRDDLQIGRDGIRLIDNTMFRKTKGQQWRKIDAGGSWF